MSDFMKYFLISVLIPVSAIADQVFPTKLSSGNDLPICAGERGEIIGIAITAPLNPKFTESWSAVQRAGHSNKTLWRRNPTQSLMELPVKSLVRMCHGWTNIENVVTVDGRQSVLADESCADVYGMNFTVSYQCPNALLGTRFECEDRPIRRQARSTRKQGQCNGRDFLEPLGATVAIPFAQLESPRVVAAWSVPAYGSGHTVPILVGARDDLPYKVCGSAGFDVRVSKKDGSLERKSLASCVIVAGTDISIIQLGNNPNRFGTYERYPL